MNTLISDCTVFLP